MSSAFLSTRRRISKPRPTSLTLISWFLIITSATSFIGSLVSLLYPQTAKMVEMFGGSMPTLILLNFLGGITQLLAGIAMLKRLQWGRVLYFIAAPLIILGTLLMYNFRFTVFVIPSFGLFLVLVWFLTRMPVNKYFSDAPANSSAVPELELASESLTGRRIAGLLLMIPGGLMLTTLCMIMLPLAQHTTALLVVSGILGFLSCLFIVPAIFLWGKQRWAIVMGMLFVAVGGMLLLYSMMMGQVLTMQEFQAQLAAADPAFFEQMIQGSVIFGGALVVLGVLLILIQRELDKGRKTQAVPS